MATGVADVSDIETKAPYDLKKGAEQLQCVVVTPERRVLDEVVDFVALPLYDGELGVLPGRAPLIARLGFGELRLRSGTAVSRYFVDGGFAQVRDDVVTVLTARAIPVFEIDTVAASKDLEQAHARRGTTDAEQAEKSRAIDRARAQLRVASHKG
ncbi:MAG TPA: ATP synthase F1 subunit epsilon [Isosphaeraceae bacterium]|jgi:F-type H+-transporting ATPase subunit epsilon|nr:ATP synthase F1 subunit epsilon [Isosphaeraceae bacterium]